MTATYERVVDVAVPCGTNPDLFDLDRGGDPVAAAEQCARCPFSKRECARLALAGDPDGRVWAGVPVAGRMTTGVPKAEAYRRLVAIAGLTVSSTAGPCRVCERPMRRRNESAMKNPGAVLVKSGDLCVACHSRGHQ